MELIRLFTTTDFPRDPAWITAFRLIFILKGDLSLYVGTKERHLHPHDFTFIRPFELHGGSNAADQCKALMIDIAPELWADICPGLEKLQFSISILRANDRSNTYQSICKALAQIVYYSSSSELYTQARVCRSVTDILAILIEDFASLTDEDRGTNQTLDRIQEILRYIVNNYTRKLSLEETAGAIGFHPQYFSAYFKKQFGVSFTDYLNNYRVGKSIPMLRDTEDSILNIALACGFNSHKSYNNAFEKYYFCSPREYRRILRSTITDSEKEYSGDDFEYLRRFWSKTLPDEQRIKTEKSTCTIRPGKKGNPKTAFENTSHNIVSVGRAISCLRSDMQKQLIRARQDLELEYVRIRDIFSDDLSVYYEDRNKTPVTSWRAVDEILDFLISADLKPFIEIGYMPMQLASKKQYAGWQYHPNVSFPKSVKLWELLMGNFIRHLISRYGKETIETWLFDFWTSPNLMLANGYWNESMERFFYFYRITYQVIKGIDENIRFGSPNFSYPSGIDEYSQFLSYAKKHHITPDFISIHLYSCGDGEEHRAETFIEFSVFDNNYRIPNIKPERSHISNAVDHLRDLIDRTSFQGLPIVIDDWNVSFFPTDFTRDTCFMGPLVIENYFQTCGKVFGMGFASLSDIHEDFFNTDQLFNGGPGLLTYSGIPKSSYYAMCMAYRFSRHIIDMGNSFIIGKTDTGYEILIYNMDYYNKDYVGNDPNVISFTKRYNVFEEASDLDCHIELPAEAGSYSIVRTLISQNHGSSYDAWVQMGSPSDITLEIAQYLNQVSTPKMLYDIVHCTNSIMLDETLEPHSVLHIKINRTSSLTS